MNYTSVEVTRKRNFVDIGVTMKNSFQEKKKRKKRKKKFDRGD